MRTSLPVLALILGLLHLNGWPVDPWARLVTKAGPVLILALWTALGSGPEPLRKRVIGGLLLSALGDVLLSWPGADLFVAGLAAFLLAHVVYVWGFVSQERGAHWPVAVPFLLWGAGAWLVVRPGLDPGLVLPVTVYCLALVAMMWRAAARLRAGRPGGAAGTAGALVFGVSDTLLAVNRFAAPFAGADVLILATYWAGQYGIARSACPEPTD